MNTELCNAAFKMHFTNIIQIGLRYCYLLLQVASLHLGPRGEDLETAFIFVAMSRHFLA